MGRAWAQPRPGAPVLRAAGAGGLCAPARRGHGHDSAYDLEVRQHCPNTQVVYDLFHVVAKYGREVIDRVRVNEANRLRQDRPARGVVKTSRWLLRNRQNVPREHAVKLDELLAANHALLTVYLLKDDLKRLWRYRHAGWARRVWLDWKRRALDSGLEPLKVFVRRLEPYLPGILAHCSWPLGTNLVEGINNKIKVIKRMAYGYRDEPTSSSRSGRRSPDLGEEPNLSPLLVYQRVFRRRISM